VLCKENLIGNAENEKSIYSKEPNAGVLANIKIGTKPELKIGRAHV